MSALVVTALQQIRHGSPLVMAVRMTAIQQQVEFFSVFLPKPQFPGCKVARNCILWPALNTDSATVSPTCRSSSRARSLATLSTG